MSGFVAEFRFTGKAPPLRCRWGRKMKAMTVAILAMLSGCAMMKPPQASAEDIAKASEPLICSGPDQCSIYWKRAQLWVAQNGGMKIQIATDAIIETYNPPNGSLTRWYRITKEPLGGTSERIWIFTRCGNMFGCLDADQTVAARFKQYVKG